METRSAEGLGDSIVYARDVAEPHADGPSLELLLETLMAAVLRAAAGRRIDSVRFFCEPKDAGDLWTVKATLSDARC